MPSDNRLKNLGILFSNTFPLGLNIDALGSISSPRKTRSSFSPVPCNKMSVSFLLLSLYSWVLESLEEGSINIWLKPKSFDLIISATGHLFLNYLYYFWANCIFGNTFSKLSLIGSSHLGNISLLPESFTF